MDGHPQFPATSLSRSTAARLQPSTTHDFHPLSSSPPPTDSIPQAQKYKPYTPRTRVAPATTINALVYPPSPSSVAGEDATSKLQLTKARSEAQNLGLDSSSIGWAILDKVVVESETGELWAEIWSSITSGKATILLPTEPLSAHDRLTPEFLKDHIAYCDAPSDDQARKPTPFVTLSGLRGIIHGTSLTFSTTLHPLSTAFQSLRDPVTRPSALSKLPSLSSTNTSSENSRYPEFRVLNGPTTLPLPPRAPVASKPPLPPRPGARPLANTTSSTAPSAPTSSSRIPNPFASLFGGGGHRHSTSNPSTSGVFSSPSPSLRSNDSLPINAGADAAHQTVEVSAIVIDKKVDRKAIGKMLNEALSKEIKAMLSGQEVPRWVALRVTEFCQPWFPFIRATKNISTSLPNSAAKVVKEDKDKDMTISPDWNVNLDGTNGEGLIEDKMDFVQEFYMQLEEGLRVDLESNGEGGVYQNGDMEKEEMEKMEQSELRVRHIMELVERTICSLFYDRLFMQPQTDDAKHDAALSNRIAALNLLDLTLEHLDIEISETSSIPKINTIVRDCGQRLCDLDVVRAPKDKARILVEAHQIVVDGLSKLPPIRLMSAEESKALRERLQRQQQQAANAKESNNVTPSVGPQVLLTTSSREVRTTAASPTTTTPTTMTAESTTLLVSAEGGTPSPTRRDAEMPHMAELSPLSFATKETLSSSSPSRASSPLIPDSTAHSNADNDHTNGGGADEPRKNDSNQDPEPKPKPKPKPKPTPVSSDILLPMIIFSVVKSNPPHLVSNLLYTQRFRNQSAFIQEGNGGESFCLINLVAVAEFLENVDLEGLGLGSAADASAMELSPITARTPTPISTTTTAAAAQVPSPTTPKMSASGTPIPSAIDLRGKVEQRVDALAGSANKVFSGVVDSSFGILKSLLPHQQQQQQQGGGGGGGAINAIRTTSGLDSKSMGIIGEGAGAGGGVVETSTTAKPGQGFGVVRRETSGFSIASIISRAKVQQQGEDGQPLVDVGASRPGSVKSFRDEGSESESGDEDEEEDSEEEEEEEGSEEDSDGGEEGDGGEGDNEDMRSDYSAREFGESEEDEDRTRRGINIPGIQITSQPWSPYMSKGPSQSASSVGTDTRSIRSFESMMNDSKKRQEQKKKMKVKKKIKQKVKKANERERKEREREKEKEKEKEKDGKGNGGSKDVSVRSGREPRKSISDRLASVSALVGGLGRASSSPPGSRRASLLQPPSNIVAPIPVQARLSGSPASSRAPSPSATSRSPSPLLKTIQKTNMTTTTVTRVRESPSEFPLPLPLPPSSTLPTPAASQTQTQAQSQAQSQKQSRSLPQPNRKFLECTSVEELRIAEVKELLEEYKKLVEGVRNLGLDLI